MAPRLESPLPDAESLSWFCPILPPITVARTTNRIQPRIAVLRCVALQRPARAARFFGCMVLSPVWWGITAEKRPSRRTPSWGGLQASSTGGNGGPAAGWHPAAGELPAPCVPYLRTGRSVLSRLDEPGLVGVDHRLHAVAQAELAEQVRDVGLDCGVGEDQRRGDLGVGEAGGEHPQHLLLALSELGDLVRRARDGRGQPAAD